MDFIIYVSTKVNEIMIIVIRSNICYRVCKKYIIKQNLKSINNKLYGNKMKLL